MTRTATYLALPFRWQDLAVYFFLLLFSVFLVVTPLAEGLKYFKYTLPLLMGIALLPMSRRIVLPAAHGIGWRYLKQLFVVYIVGFALNLPKGFANPRFYQEVYFILSPLVFAAAMYLLKRASGFGRSSYVLFWGVSAAFIAETFPHLLEVALHPSVLVGGLLTSEMPTESNYAFEFGFFLLVFLQRRAKFHSFLSFVLLLLAFKRIALVAVIAVLFAASLKRLSKGRINIPQNKPFMLLTNFTVVTALFLFFSGYFDDWIETTFGLTSNFITQGRYNIYQDIFHHFGRVDLLGFGLGSINSFLTNTGYELVNLHSDLLKVFFELGPVFFVFWLVFLYGPKGPFLARALVMYLNVLFLTDNVFIYFDVMFVFYFLTLEAYHTSDLQKNVRP